MATIKLFESWLTEQKAPVKKPATKPHEGTAAAQTGAKYGNADDQGVLGYGNPGVFNSEIMANGVKAPFISKKKPGFIVDVQFPPQMTRDKTQWFFDVNAYEIFPSKSTPDQFLSRMWQESYSLNLPENHPSMKNNSTFTTPEFPTFSLEGNPAPTDIPKGSTMDVAASDMFKVVDGTRVMSMPDLYAQLTDWTGSKKMTPDQFASLIDSAKPGAKASLLKQIPTIKSDLASDSSYKELIAWAKTQAPAQTTTGQVKPIGG